MNYPTLPSDCKSMLCKHLTPELYSSLSSLKTANGFTLDDAIRSGVENIDSGIGVYAGDLESYELFGALFDPIIEEYHGYSTEDTHQSDLDSISPKCTKSRPRWRVYTLNAYQSRA